ncbi:MAG: P-loop NTPase, partial [Candidatus Rokuibacteriota bacterium]
VSQLVVRKSITVAAQTKAPILGLVENMAGLFPGPDAAGLAGAAGIPFLGRVPFDHALAAAADRGEVLAAKDPRRDSVRALQAIASELRAALETGTRPV